MTCQEYDITLKHDALFPQMPVVPMAFEKIHKERCRERSINNEVEADIREQVRQQVQKYDITLKLMWKYRIDHCPI